MLTRGSTKTPLYQGLSRVEKTPLLGVYDTLGPTKKRLHAFDILCWDSKTTKWQGMLKEIRTLVSSSGSASAASAAVVAPTRRASALFSQVAENEYRRHSILPGDAVDTRWARTTGKGLGADAWCHRNHARLRHLCTSSRSGVF